MRGGCVFTKQTDSYHLQFFQEQAPAFTLTAIDCQRNINHKNTKRQKCVGGGRGERKTII